MYRRVAWLRERGREPMMMLEVWIHRGWRVHRNWVFTKACRWCTKWKTNTIKRMLKARKRRRKQMIAAKLCSISDHLTQIIWRTLTTASRIRARPSNRTSTSMTILSSTQLSSSSMRMPVVRASSKTIIKLVVGLRRSRTRVQQAIVVPTDMEIYSRLEQLPKTQWSVLTRKIKLQFMSSLLKMKMVSILTTELAKMAARGLAHPQTNTTI